MKKHKRKGGIIIALIVAVVYIILFPGKQGRELILEPVNLVNLESDPVFREDEPGALLGFRLDGVFGYLDKKGQLYHKGTIQHNIALSTGGYINYSSIQTEDQSLVFFDPAGEFKSSIRLAGYPLLSEDGKRLFILNINGSGIREINENGDLLWGTNSTKLITSMAVGTEHLCLGFSNGLLQLYNKEGQVIFEYTSGNSRIPIILGCALSGDEKRIAAVSGIGPQHLVYIEHKDNKYLSPVYHELDTDFRREVFLRFSGDGENLFVEQPGHILNYHIKARKGTLIPVKGKLRSFSLSGSYFSVLSGTGKYSLYIYNYENTLIAGETFSADYIFNKLVDTDLFLGIDHYLLKIHLSKK